MEFAMDSQDHQKDLTICTKMRLPLETGAPHPHLTHSTANTTLTKIISVMEIEHAHNQDIATEPQDHDLHPNKINSIFFMLSADTYYY